MSDRQKFLLSQKDKLLKALAHLDYSYKKIITFLKNLRLGSAL